MFTISDHLSLARRMLPPVILAATLAGCAYHPAAYHGNYGQHDGSPDYQQAGAPPASAVRRSAGVSNIQPARLTFGEVKRHLRIGVSNQAEVVRVLGSPNNMTINGLGREIWVYDRINTQIDTSNFRTGAGIKLGFGTIGTGVGAGVMFDAGEHRDDTSMVSTTKTLTVVLEFDDRFILRDMLVREGRY